MPEVGAAPPQTTRAAAMLHAAIYDAVNGIEGTFDPYAIELEAPKGASTEAAVVGAGYTVLSELFPEQIDLFNLQRDHPHFSRKARSLNSEALPDLSLTLVLTPAVKRHCVVRVPVGIRINYNLNKKQFTWRKYETNIFSFVINFSRKKGLKLDII
ncbi:MAG: hypothetical protein WBM44_06135 [Waterburya sp.]